MNLEEYYSTIVPAIVIGGLLSVYLFEKISNRLHERDRKNALADEVGKKCMENILAIACYERGKERWRRFPKEEIKKQGVKLSPPDFYNKKLFQIYLRNNPEEKARFNQDIEIYTGMLRMREKDIEHARLKLVDAEFSPI